MKGTAQRSHGQLLCSRTRVEILPRSSQTGNLQNAVLARFLRSKKPAKSEFSAVRNPVGLGTAIGFRQNECSSAFRDNQLPKQIIEQFERLIRRDPANRGLISGEDEYGPLCAGHLSEAAFHLAEHATHVGLLTGFYVPQIGRASCRERV